MASKAELSAEPRLRVQPPLVPGSMVVPGSIFSRAGVAEEAQRSAVAPAAATAGGPAHSAQHERRFPLAYAMGPCWASAPSASLTSGPTPQGARGLVVHGLGTPTPLEHILSFTSPGDIVAALPVNRFWASVAASDAVWSPVCEHLWADKVYVPDRFQDVKAMCRLDAFWGSLADSKRTAITVEELCSFQWSNRMKGWAGPDWTSNDAWWRGTCDQQGATSSTRRYKPDGTMVSAERGAGKWRFVPQSSGRHGPKGCFVRHARGGRDYPTHFTSRWSKNWGWILQNCWGFSTSFPLPRKGLEPELEDDGEICQSVTVDTCREEAMLFNMGLPLPYEAEGDDEESFGGVRVGGANQRLSVSFFAAVLAGAGRYGRGRVRSAPSPHDGSGGEEEGQGREENGLDEAEERRRR